MVVMMVLSLVVCTVPAGAVDNPMTEDLDADGYDISDVGQLTADDIVTKSPWVDACAYNSGALNNTTVSAAISAIGSDERTVLLAPGTWSFTGDVTVPDNITLRFERGAVIAVSSGYTLTINGPIDAGLQQLFTSTSDIVLGDRVGQVHPEWWHDISGSDCKNAVQTAIDSGKKVILSALYPISSNLILKSGTFIEGRGYTTGVTSTAANVRPFQNENRTGPSCTDANIVIRNLRIVNNKAGSTSEYSHCMDLRYIEGLTIDTVWCEQAEGDGIFLLGNENVKVTNASIDDVGRQGVSVVSGDHIYLGEIYGRDVAMSIVDIEPNPDCSITNLTLRNVYSISGNGRTVNLYNDEEGAVINGCRVDNIDLGYSPTFRGIQNGVFKNLRTSSYASSVGLTIYNCDNCVLENFISYGTDIAGMKLKISSSDDITVTHAVIAGPNDVSNIGIEILSSTNVRLENTTLSDAGLYGLWIRNSTEVIVDHMLIQDGGSIAVALTPTTSNDNIRLEGLTVLNTPTGIYLSGTNGDVYLDGNLLGTTTPLNITGTCQISYGDLMGLRRTTYGTSAPASGAWNRGDRCWSTSPSAASAPGWICVTAGTPGTWKAMASLAE